MVIDPDFVRLVYELRKVQRHYQKTGDGLREVVDLEKQVDRKLEDSLKPRPAGMFDDWVSEA